MDGRGIFRRRFLIDLIGGKDWIPGRMLVSKLKRCRVGVHRHPCPAEVFSTFDLGFPLSDGSPTGKPH